MANERLNDYIKKCIEIGKQREEITNNLLGVGWSKEDIDASFSAVGEKEVKPIDYFSNALNNEINSIQKENNNLNGQLSQKESSVNMRRKEVIEEEEGIIDDSEKNNSKKIITPIVVIIIALLIFSTAFAFIQKIGPFSSLEIEPEIVQENENVIPQEEEVVEEPEVVVIWNCGEELIDERDGKSYPTVLIGSQCWMTKNLNYITGNSFCYNDDVENCEEHGLLYDWNTAIIACPLGWSLPSDSDFKILERYLGMEEEKIDVTGWREISPNAQGTLELLNITLSGSRDISEKFKYKGEYANLWLSDSVDDLYSARSFRAKDSNIYKGNVSGEYGYSVRCIKY